MEVLTLLMKHFTEHEFFQFHPKCQQMKIINLCFADDLFIFSHGDLASIKAIKKALDTFTACSGLKPNPQKSSIFFGNTSTNARNAIKETLNFEEGELPVRYLGVPLISTRLRVRDCQCLIDRVDRKVHDWRNKALSFAGRVQLIISVLSSMQVYWSSVFLLPTTVINKIEKLMREFLWAHGEDARGKSKVSWKTICLPKEQGGLGLRSLAVWNVALMASQLWKVVINKNSLWVRWIHTYRLRGRNIWDVPIKQDASWGWRNVLKIREQLRPFFLWEIGNGNKVSMWYDKWCPHDRLDLCLTKRQIKQGGFSDSLKVRDMVLDHGWKWPQEWNIQIPQPQLANKKDVCKLVDVSGIVYDFSVRNLWEIIRPKSYDVPWYRIVWFPQRIPRHGFILWLAVKERLRTHDKMRHWNYNMQNAKCFLCKSNDESHQHLFFECSYSVTSWTLLKRLAGMKDIPPNLNEITDFLIPRVKTNAAWSIMARMVVAALVYYIWQERNNRVFGNGNRTPEQLTEVVKEVVRAKFSTLMFKNTRNVQRIADVWKMALMVRKGPGIVKIIN